MIRKMSMLLASASLAAGMAAAPVRADEKAAAAVVALGILGIAAMALAFRTTRAIEERGASADAEPLPAPPAAQSPFTSGKGSTIG